MPGFIISVNDATVGALSTDGLNVVAIHVHGDTIGPELAEIDITGGNYEENSAKRHLIYVSELQIGEHDLVEIRFVTDVETTLRGRTIEELHPIEPEQAGPLESEEEILADLKATPNSREHFNFEVVAPSGELITGKTPLGTFTFGLHVLWDWMRPDSARVSVSSNTLEQISKRESGERYARIVLQFDQSVQMRLSN